MSSLSRISEKVIFDVAIVGAGVAGLSAAIKLKQLDPGLEVCVLEKSSIIGGHILSGALFNPRALYELLPKWQEMASPLQVNIKDSKVVILRPNSHINLPSSLTPWKADSNTYIVSLPVLCTWLSKVAESLGVRIFESFTAKDLIYSQTGKIEGLTVAEVGVNPDGSRKEGHQSALDILCKYVLLADGAKGLLSSKVIQKYKLLGYHDIQYQSQAQTWALGFKETWTRDSVPAGLAVQTFGWPSRSRSRGFVYTEEHKVHVGFIGGLDYSNPHIDLYEEFQLFKSHEFVKQYLQGKCLEFGAKVTDDGGFFSVPKLSIPGGLVLGAAGGLTNPLTYMGAHLAMKSGIIAGEVIVENWGKENQDLDEFYKRYTRSWVFDELFRSRNMRQAFNHSYYFGIWYSWFNWSSAANKSSSFIETSVKGDNYSASEATFNVDRKVVVEYPEKDGKFAVDKEESLRRAGLVYARQQNFIKIKPELQHAPKLSFSRFAGLESKVCPTGVFKYEDEKLVIDPSKCIQCGACSVKSVREMIEFNFPEAGTGPVYTE